MQCLHDTLALFTMKKKPMYLFHVHRYRSKLYLIPNFYFKKADTNNDKKPPTSISVLRDNNSTSASCCEEKAYFGHGENAQSLGIRHQAGWNEWIK